MSKIMRVMVALVTVLLAARGDAQVVVRAKPVAYSGEAAGIVIEGLAAGDAVRLHSLQRWGKWQQVGEGKWGEVATVIHAWAEFRADGAGRVDVDGTSPIAGTYATADPLGLFWSGYRRGDGRLDVGLAPEALAFEPASNSMLYLLCERAGKIEGRAEVRRAVAPPEVSSVEVHEPGLAGVFASRQGATKLPAVIILHGSEGGDMASARGMAEVYAAHGFAALAVVWFSQEYRGVRDVPRMGVKIDLAVLDRARAYLETRPEADAARIGAVGVSKGAEMAVLGATKYPWLRAVVGVVPSDVVWEGFGWESKPEERGSTWAWQGTPLAYVPLIPYDDKDPGRWKSNTQRYSASRAQASPEAVEAARIPIEKSGAAFLLLAGERDEVWASAEMARALEARMNGAGKADKVQVEIYPMAGHQLVGTGVFPVWLYADDGDNLGGVREGRDVRATGAATVKAWARTVEFLRTRL